MSGPTVHSVGVILGSTRQPRVCPEVANFVISTINNQPFPTTTADLHAPNPQSDLQTPPPPQPQPSPIPDLPPFTLHPIDLSTNPLPLFNEPTIPSRIHSASDYAQPHTRAWSLEIQQYSAFIFVTPQYNWGYPAVLKNAIDYLFNEWAHKPAMIVSYGGHGGTRAAGQLRQVLTGVEMRVAETMPALTFAGREMLIKAATGKEIDAASVWDGESEVVRKAFAELMTLLAEEGNLKRVDGKTD